MLSKPVKTNLLHVNDVAVCKITTRCQTNTEKTTYLAVLHVDYGLSLLNCSFRVSHSCFISEC